MNVTPIGRATGTAYSTHISTRNLVFFFPHIVRISRWTHLSASVKFKLTQIAVYGMKVAA